MLTSRSPNPQDSGLTSQRCPLTRQLAPNRVRHFDGFHVSYCAHTRDYGCVTTALVLGGHVFFVLRGDHAGALIEAAELSGLEGCVERFLDLLEHAHDLSVLGEAPLLRARDAASNAAPSAAIATRPPPAHGA